MPWVCFLHVFVRAAFQDLWVYASPRPLEDTSDMLSILPVRNLWPGGRVCLGSLKFGLEGPLGARIACVQRHFWESSFNDDLPAHYERDQPPEIVRARQGEEEHFAAWQRLSRVGGFDPCALSWKPHKPLTEILDHILSGGE